MATSFSLRILTFSLYLLQMTMRLFNWACRLMLITLALIGLAALVLCREFATHQMDPAELVQLDWSRTPYFILVAAMCGGLLFMLFYAAIAPFLGAFSELRLPDRWSRWCKRLKMRASDALAAAWLPIGARIEGHYDRIRPRPRQYLELTMLVVGLAVCGSVVWRGIMAPHHLVFPAPPSTIPMTNHQDEK